MRRIWLAGSRSFGAAVATELSELPGAEIVAVTSSMDDALGDWARENQVPLFDTHVPADRVQAKGVDVIVSAQNYAWIGPEARTAAKRGAIGYHPSLLPRHRGRSSVEWTIAMGDPIAGGTVYQMDDSYDTGPIIRQAFCHVVPSWTASDLWREALFPMGVRMLRDVVATMGYGQVMRIQDERVATEEPKWTGSSNIKYENRSRMSDELTVVLLEGRKQT